MEDTRAIHIQAENYAEPHTKYPCTVVMRKDSITIGQRFVIEPAALLYILQEYQDFFGGFPVTIDLREWRGIASE